MTAEAPPVHPRDCLAGLCPSCSARAALAERTLRLIERNGIRDPDAIATVAEMVENAGTRFALVSLRLDDEVPF